MATKGERKPLIPKKGTVKKQIIPQRHVQTHKTTVDDIESDKAKLHLQWAGDRSKSVVKADASILDGSMNLAACAFGASMLSLSYAMDISGGLVGLAMIIVLGLMAVVAANSILNAGYRFTKSTYTKIVEEALGSTMGIICEVLLSLCLFVAAVSYVVGLADLVPSLIPIFSHMGRTVRILVIYVGLWPLTMVGNLSAFGPASLLACVGCYIQAAALVYAAATSGLPAPAAADVFKFKPVGFVFSLPMVTFTYAFHYVLTDTCLEIKAPSKPRLMSTVGLTTGTLGFCYLLVATSGYILYQGNKIPANVLSGFPDGSVVIAIARWSIATLLFVTFSLFIIPLRKRFEELYTGDQTTSVNKDRMLIGTAIGGLVVCTSIGLPDLSLANAVAGGCIAFVMFVFPGILDIYRYMKFKQDRTPIQLIRGIVLATTGFVAGMIGLFGSLLPFAP